MGKRTDDSNVHLVAYLRRNAIIVIRMNYVKKKS